MTYTKFSFFKLLTTSLGLCSLSFFSLLSFPLQVEAVTYTDTYTCSVPLTRTDWRTGPDTNLDLSNCNLTKFDSALGDLTSVTVTMNSDIEHIWRVENLNSQARNISLDVYSLDIGLDKPDGTNLLTINAPYTNTVSLSSNDGALDYAGTGGISFDGVQNPVISDSGSETATYTVATDPATVALFESTNPGTPEQVELTARADGLWQCIGSSNSACVVETFASAEVTVTYSYQAHNLAFQKTSVGTFIAGRQGEYQFTISNLENEPAPTPIVLVDTVPNGLTFASNPDANWACSQSGQILTCTSNVSIAANGSVSMNVIFNIDPNITETVTNTAGAQSSLKDPTPLDAVDTDVVNVEFVPQVNNSEVTQEYQEGSPEEIVKIAPEDFIVTDQDSDAQITEYIITEWEGTGTIYIGDPKNGGTVYQVGDAISPSDISNIYVLIPNPDQNKTFIIDFVATDNTGLQSNSGSINGLLIPLTQNAVVDGNNNPATNPLNLITIRTGGQS